MKRHDSQPASPEQVLGESESYLKKAEYDLISLEDFVENKSPESMDRDKVLELIIEVRLSFRNIDYWTQSYGPNAKEGKKTDPLITRLLKEKEALVLRLEEIENSFNFDFASFEKKDRENNTNKSLVNPLLDLMDIPPGVDFEEMWGEITSRLESGRGYLLQELRILTANALKGEVDIVLFEELRAKNEIFKQVLRELRKRLTADSERYEGLLIELSSFEDEEETKLINIFLNNFFKEYSDKEDEKKEESEWPLSYAKELVASVAKINSSFEAIEKRLNRSFNYDLPEDIAVLEQIKTDFNEQVLLIESLEENKFLVEESRNLLKPSENLKMAAVVLRRLELSRLLESADKLDDASLKIDYLVWKKTIFLLHPELRFFDKEFSLDSPIISGSEEAIFSELLAFAEKINPLLKNATDILGLYSEEDEKKEYISTNFLDPISKELSKRDDAAFNYWKDNFSTFYPELHLTNGSFMGVLADLEEIESEHLADQNLYNLIFSLEKKIKVAKEQVSTSTVLDSLGSKNKEYLDHLESIWQRANAQLDRLKNLKIEQEKNIPANVKLAVHFFEGTAKEVHDATPSWFEEGWKQSSPSVLAGIIWKFTHNQVFLAKESRARDIYGEVNFLGTSLNMDHHQKVEQLLVSFAALGTYLKVPSSEKEEFENLSGRLIVDFATMSKIFTYGDEMDSNSGNPDYLFSKKNLDGEDMKRILLLGEGYTEEEKTTADRFLWANDAWEALNGPDFYPYSLMKKPRIYVDDPEENYELVKSVFIKNPLTDYPIMPGKNEDKQNLNRLVMRLISGSNEKPKWVSNPLTKNRNESSVDFASRKKKYIQECLLEIMYGRDYSGDLLNADTASASSIWGRLVASGESYTNEAAYLNETEQESSLSGMLSERLAQNFQTANLGIPFAEASSFSKLDLSDSRVSVDSNGQTVLGLKMNDGSILKLPVINPTKGPIAAFYHGRNINFMGYLMKIFGTEKPKKQVSWFLATKINHLILPMLEYYQMFDHGEKVSLSQKLMLGESSSALSKEDWYGVLGSEKRLPWGETIRQLKPVVDKIWNGTGVNFSEIVSLSHGGETKVNKDYEKIFSSLLVDIDYLFNNNNKQIVSFETLEELHSFEKAMSFFNENGLSANMPAGMDIESFELAKKHFKDFDESNSKFALIKYKDATSGKIIYSKNRLPTLFNILMPDWFFHGNGEKSPDYEYFSRFLDTFSKSLVENRDNDDRNIIMKYIFGIIIVGDLAKSQGSLSPQDLEKIRVFFNKESYDKFRGKMSNRMAMIISQSKELEHSATGAQNIFSEREINSLLDVATVLNPSIKTMLRDLKA